jgi:hypothetical protein
MAAGKSTVAQRLSKSVHLRGDLFRRMIVSGQIDLEPPFTDDKVEQLRLRYQVASTVAGMYCDAGFTVCYQDIILGADLEFVADMLRPTHRLYVVVLCPSPEVVTQREAGRNKVGYFVWTPAQLDQELRVNTPRLGLWLDTSMLSIEQTVVTILDRIDEAAL